jgi:hypothetical protein
MEMGNENEIYRIDLPKDGITKKEGRLCIYAILIQDKDDKQYIYVGKTGTTNGPGFSSPMGRLASHIKKIGKTRSLFHDNEIFKEHFRKNNYSLDGCIVKFLFQFWEIGFNIKKNEEALIEYFSSKENDESIICLNVSNTKVDNKNTEQLEKLINKIKEVFNEMKTAPKNK